MPGQRRHGRPNRIGEQGLASARELSVTDKSPLFRNADQRSNAVEEIEKEKNENYRNCSKLEGSGDVELQCNRRNGGWRTEDAVKAHDTKEKSQSRAGHNSGKDRAPQTADQHQGCNDDSLGAHPDGSIGK